MLWISYGGPGNVTKQVVEAVVTKIARLIYPYPVAAEDLRSNSLGIIARDGYNDGMKQKDATD